MLLLDSAASASPTVQPAGASERCELATAIEQSADTNELLCSKGSFTLLTWPGDFDMRVPDSPAERLFLGVMSASYVLPVILRTQSLSKTFTVRTIERILWICWGGGGNGIFNIGRRHIG